MVVLLASSAPVSVVWRAGGMASFAGSGLGSRQRHGRRPRRLVWLPERRQPLAGLALAIAARAWSSMGDILAAGRPRTADAVEPVGPAP